MANLLFSQCFISNSFINNVQHKVSNSKTKVVILIKKYIFRNMYAYYIIQYSIIYVWSLQLIFANQTLSRTDKQQVDTNFHFAIIARVFETTFTISCATTTEKSNWTSPQNLQLSRIIIMETNLQSSIKTKLYQKINEMHQISHQR